MSETVVVQRPTSFHIELHVDPSDDDATENDISLTTKSWRVQFLRLAQRAPQPIPVLCKEPRTFPHFGNVNRISESSWTSATTHSTDITTGSVSGLNSITTTEKGENYQIAPDSWEDDSSFNTELSTTNGAKTRDAVVVVVDDDDDSSSSKVGKGVENVVDGNGTNGIDEVRDVKLSNRPSFPQEDSNGKVDADRKHQLQQKVDKNGCRSSRHCILSIQGDSEYWEKFRYSKDYQSSLMIETICNEVFNLKPSPRYKSLLKLSETGNRKMSRDKKKTESPPHHLALGCNDNDDDENGIKVEIADAKAKRAGTKKVRSISLPLAICSESEEQDGQEGQDKNVKSILCGKHQQQKEDIDDDEAENTKSGERRNWENIIRKKSTTSSVYTTTTATTQDPLENDGIRRERLFGLAFHGYLTKQETEKLLSHEGQYLVRQLLNEDGFILSFRYDNTILNYRLLCDVEYSSNTGNGTRDTFTNLPDENDVSCTYYLEDRRKCYHSLDELVREGLITLHLDENAGSYIDLLVELAQFPRNSNLLQTPLSPSAGSRKTSRSASFRVAKLPSTSSTAGIDGGGGSENGDDNSPSITDERFSRDIALRIHFFEEEVFDRFVKCQVCTIGIWSFSNKGLRCRDCSLCVHESCIDNVKTECEPDLATLSPFSTELTSLVKGNRKNNKNHSFGPPYILEKCINELEARGLTAEGIYRMCGSVEDIEKLKSMFEQEKIKADLSKHLDIHSITGLIKLFLRQLPESLITQEKIIFNLVAFFYMCAPWTKQDVFDEFSKDKSNIDEMKIDAVQILVFCLPPAHRLTLRYMLQHLQRVTLEKASNKMNAFNLSSVLMPSILCPENMSFDTLESGTRLLQFMITHVEEIFKR